MARTRSIKPEFWSDEKVGTLSFMERLLFLGMWNFSDDEGLIKASPLYLKAMVFPYDNIKEKDIESAINNLSNKQLIFCFVQNNQQYAWIIKLRVYQRIDKPQKPNNPAPSIQNTKYRMAIFKRDNYVCHICGESTEISTNSNDSNFPTVDHLIPQSKGGNHYPSNLKTACSRCNKGRCDTDLDQFQEDSKNILRTFTSETETETETGAVSRKRASALSDEEFLKTLKDNPVYEGLDVDELYQKMLVWCKTNGKKPTRRRFVNWLNREERPLQALKLSANQAYEVTPYTTCPSCGAEVLKDDFIESGGKMICPKCPVNREITKRRLNDLIGGMLKSIQ